MRCRLCSSICQQSYGVQLTQCLPFLAEVSCHDAHKPAACNRSFTSALQGAQGGMANLFSSQLGGGDGAGGDAGMSSGQPLAEMDGMPSLSGISPSDAAAIMQGSKKASLRHLSFWFQYINVCTPHCDVPESMWQHASAHECGDGTPAFCQAGLPGKYVYKHSHMACWLSFTQILKCNSSAGPVLVQRKDATGKSISSGDHHMMKYSDDEGDGAHDYLDDLEGGTFMAPQHHSHPIPLGAIAFHACTWSWPRKTGIQDNKYLPAERADQTEHNKTPCRQGCICWD